MSRDKISITKDFECHLNDLAVAFWETANISFGKDCIVGMKEGIFYRNAIQFIGVKTNDSKYAKGVIGAVEVKGVPGYFSIGSKDGEPIVRAVVTKEFEERVNDFFTTVTDYLKKHSIYKGKALTSGLEFMDLSGVSLAELTYSKEVLNDLKEHVWSLIKQRELCKSMNIKLQRKVLFSGNFGTGKTIAAFLTAKIATENGFTFIYMEPSIKSSYSTSIDSVLRFARRSQPAVVLFEDWDREQREGDMFAAGHIMSAVDGVLSKTSEVIVILTTNHPNKITPGMQRPGRIDKIINFNQFGEEDVIRLLKTAIPEKIFHSEINWREVAKSCENYSAAFVNEVGISSKLKAIRLANGGTPVITQDMLVSAAQSLESRSKKCQEAFGFSPAS